MAPISLLTTLRYAPRQPKPFPLLEYHVARLVSAWQHFASRGQAAPPEGLEQDIRRHVHAACEPLSKKNDWRIRVLLHYPSAEIQVETYLMPDDSPEFQFTLESFVNAPLHSGKPITLDPEPSRLAEDSESTDWHPADLYRCKTTRRDAYDVAARRGKSAAPDAQIFDTLLHWPRTNDLSPLPTQNLITELTTSNIAIHAPSPSHAAQWITPRYHPDGAPFLRGVMRTYLIARGEVREADITVEEFEAMVKEGRRVVGMNGLRGIWLADPVLRSEQGR